MFHVMEHILLVFIHSCLPLHKNNGFKAKKKQNLNMTTSSF